MNLKKKKLLLEFLGATVSTSLACDKITCEHLKLYTTIALLYHATLLLHEQCEH